MRQGMKDSLKLRRKRTIKLAIFTVNVSNSSKIAKYTLSRRFKMKIYFANNVKVVVTENKISSKVKL